MYFFYRESIDRLLFRSKMNKQQIKQFLKDKQLKPIKKFGQNFLINQSIIQQIVQKVQKQAPPFVEVGPGLGALTQHFENRKKNILLIERDKKLANLWEQKGWTVFCADVLKFDWEKLPKKISLFGNLPYEIASSLIIKSCLHKERINNMIFTVQQEVAQRIQAKSHSKDYGLLSVMSQTFWNIHPIIHIPKTDFYPTPKVNGTALEFQTKKTLRQLPSVSFLQFVKQCFSFKRKMLFKKMDVGSPETAKKILHHLKLSENCRAEELSVDQFVQLYLQIQKEK